MDWQVVGAIGLGTIIGSIVTTTGNIILQRGQRRAQYNAWLREQKMKNYAVLTSFIMAGKNSPHNLGDIDEAACHIALLGEEELASRIMPFIKLVLHNKVDSDHKFAMMQWLKEDLHKTR